MMFRSGARAGCARRMNLAYADPPYPGNAHLYPERREVDHVRLLQRLAAYDGWALSTSTAGLVALAPLLPADVHVAAWCKPGSMPRPPARIMPRWEPVIVKPARTSGVYVRDWHYAQAPAAGFMVKHTGQDLIGSKPLSFCVWVLRLMGHEPGDVVDDVYPGAGIMARAVAAWTSQQRLEEEVSDGEAPAAECDCES